MICNLLRSFLAIFLLSGFFTVQSSAQNNALAFDGFDDQVIVSGASSLLTGGTGISLTCWVYPTNASPAFPNFDGITGFRNNTDADFYLLQLTPTSVEARFRNDQGINYDIVAPVLTVNTWNHLAFTYDGSQLRIYRNGVAVDSTPASGTMSTIASDLRIGNLDFQGTNFWLSGRMDEISMWDRALQSSELSCIGSNGIDVSTAAGLKLYYRCNQGVAGGANTGITTLTDATGNNSGSLNGFAMNGTTSNFVDGAQAIASITQFICPDSVYLFNGQLVTAPGVYYDTLVTAAGCDSIVQLNLFSLSVNTGVTQNGNVLTANHNGTFYQWLDCNNNYAPIPGATNKTFTATTIGSYAVIVQQGSCKDTSICYTVSSVGLSESLPGATISIHPTLTDGPVHIRIEGDQANYPVKISDISGRILHQLTLSNRQDNSIDLGNLPSGTYFLEVRSDDGRSVQRILRR
jgi:hypothetical protein